MAHGLILGMTESGKTTLAKHLKAGFSRAGVKSIALNPDNLSQFGADYETGNINEFLTAFKNSRSCAVFIDEAGTFCGQYADSRMIRTGTEGRHYGHSCFYIAQRGNMINKTVREQCRFIYIFRTGRGDAKLWAEEFANSDLLKAAELPAYHFLVADKLNNDVLRYKLTKEGYLKC